MKKFGLGAFLLGLASVYATVWVARKAWEKGGEQ
jgi:hypothetical protein